MPLGDLMPILKKPILGTVSFDQEKMISSPPYNIYVKLTESTDINPDKGPNVIQISNGKINDESITSWNKFYGLIQLPIDKMKFQLYNDIASKIQTGSIKVVTASRPEEPDVGIQITYKYCPTDGTKVSLEWRVQVYLRRDTVISVQPNDLKNYNNLLKLSVPVQDASDETNLIRWMETFSSMTVQQPQAISVTIAAEGMAALYFVAMIAVLAL